MWEKIKTFFQNSEVIFFAWLQIVLGFVASVLTVVDPSILGPLLPPEYLPWFLLLNGLATKYLRQRRTKKPEEPTEPTRPVEG